MKIVLDASPLLRGQTGIGTYTRELCLALHAVAPGDSISLFLNKPAAILSRPELSGWRPSVRVSRVPRRVLNCAWLDRGILPIERWFPEGDVFHATDFLLPASRRMRLVVTVHDLAWMIVPQFFGACFLRYMRRWFAASLQLAQAVIVPSARVADDLRRFFAMDSKRVNVIPYGVAARFGPGPGEDDFRIRERCGLPHDYILAMGPIEPRKNLFRLLLAFASLAPGGERTETLVVAGPGRKEAVEELAGVAEAANPGCRVILTGPLPERDLPALYRGARLFVYPSLLEGFGLPILEAMASGVPVVASNAPAIPEAGGDAALYFDPRKREDMARAIAQVLGSPQLARELRERGIERARRFTWERCARDTRSLYRGEA